MKKSALCILMAGIMSAFLIGCNASSAQVPSPESGKQAAGNEAADEGTEDASDEKADEDNEDAAGDETSTESGAELEYWTEDSKAAASIREYVEEVTDEASDKFIPVEDRIAVFDLDGTIIGELYPSYFEYMMFIHRALYDDSYDAPWDVRAFARELEAGITTGDMPDSSERLHAKYAGIAYAGMTIDELKDYTKEFKNSKAEGFEGLTRGDAYFLPMVSLVEYLDANDFQCYIVSGSDRTVVRGFIDGLLPIPANRVIGMSYSMVARGQGDTDGLDYVYSADDDVILGGDLLIKTIKMNKVSEIALEIGKVPVLSFGNSSGDLSMAQYVKNNKQYEGRAYMVLCDDLEREFGSEKKAESMKKTCEERGFETISMRDDFATIYGDGVSIIKKEAAADNAQADAETAAEAEATVEAANAENAETTVEASDTEDAETAAESNEDASENVEAEAESNENTEADTEAADAEDAASGKDAA